MAGPLNGGRIGEKMTTMVSDGVVKARSALAVMEGEVKQRITLGLMETLEREGAHQTQEQFQAVLDDPDMPDDVKDMVRTLIAPKRPIALVMIAGALVSVGLSTGTAAAAGLLDKLSRWSMRRFADRKLTAGEAADGVARGLVSAGAGAEAAKDEGFHGDVFAKQVELRKAPLPAGEVLTAVNRGEITEAVGREMLERSGYTEQSINVLMKLRLAFPSPNDLVRMAVREVFTPAIAQANGQYEDLPPKFLELAEKAGMSREFATWYWAAHWDLPSVHQGFEMLHRGKITKDQLNQLMRALDIMPAWRERLLSISYTPLTRVDVRRMHRMGAIGLDEVNKAYRDIGYDEHNAQLLTEFTAREKLEAERDLTKVEIVTLYEAQTFDRAKATALLRELGYSADEASFILDLGDQRRATSKKNRAINVVRARFLSYKIDEPTASAQMDVLQVPAAQRDDELRIWKVEREVSAPQFTVAVLQRFLKKGLIDEPGFVARVKRLGYDDEETLLWLQDAGFGQGE